VTRPIGHPARAQPGPERRAQFRRPSIVPRIAAVATVACALAEIPSANATPVNAERLRATRSKKGWVGSANLTGAYRSGNIDRVELGSDGALQYQNLHPAHAAEAWASRPAQAPAFFKDRWLLIAQLRWAQLNGATFLNSGYAHTRYTRMFIPRLGADMFLQSQYNEFTLLKTRIISGLGARVDMVHRERFNLWGGSGYMAEWEVNDTVAGDPHPARLLNHRWTSHVVFQLFLADAKLMLQNTIYAQPLLTDFADVRVLETVQIEGTITDVLSMGITFEMFYDSKPPLTVVPVDLNLGSFFKFTFG
jgi:hypothetical protein